VQPLVAPRRPRFLITHLPSTSVSQYVEVSGVGAFVFDWYNTLAPPNGDDFWSRLPELITGAGGTPDAQALHDWDEGHDRPPRALDIRSHLPGVAEASSGEPARRVRRA
jgi:hypothetical protein